MVVLFSCRKEVSCMALAKNILCPRCGRIVMRYDGKATVAMSCKCRKCNKLVVYDPEQNTTAIKKTPKRVTGSGMRFY